MRRSRRRILRSATLIGLVAGFWGCQQPGAPAWNRAELHGETFTDRSPSLVLGNPSPPAARADDRPWWVDRRDNRLNVGGAPGRAEIVDYVIRTRDRQRSHDDHIHNDYSRSTRIRERGRLVR